jgi:hypothetical protein
MRVCPGVHGYEKQTSLHVALPVMLEATHVVIDREVDEHQVHIQGGVLQDTPAHRCTQGRSPVKSMLITVVAQPHAPGTSAYVYDNGNAASLHTGVCSGCHLLPPMRGCWRHCLERLHPVLPTSLHTQAQLRGQQVSSA